MAIIAPSIPASGQPRPADRPHQWPFALPSRRRAPISAGPALTPGATPFNNRTYLEQPDPC